MTTILLLLAVVGATEESTLNNSPDETSGREKVEEGACINNAAADTTCKVVGDEKDHEEDDDEDYDDYYDYDEGEDDFKDDGVYDDDCTDKHPDCQSWANEEECDENPRFMLSDCRRACRACERHKRYSDVPPDVEGSDLGEPQNSNGDEEVSKDDILNYIVETRRYMDTQIKSKDLDPELVRTCTNSDEFCTLWSLAGECEKNPGYMEMKCGPACRTCHLLKLQNRCPMDRPTIGPDVWGPGDVDKMFRRLSSQEPYISKYNATVLSSPESGGPWVLTLDNFITDEEADRLIELGDVEGYERSMDVGDIQLDGTASDVVSAGRTSSNAWCSNECLEDELVKGVNKRISSMTQIPEVNSEDLQLLRYGVGQKYEIHHDYIDFDLDRQNGVRLITVYLYLNDVEAGGGTNFSDLDVTVMPKRGSVLIWPSVLDSDPNEWDDRTHHQALPVEAGLKYGANAWFHMRDFKGPNRRGC